MIAKAARWVLALGAVALSMAGASGCFFDTREPEVPEQIDTTATRWRPPTHQDVLTNNIRVTFEDQQIDFYRRSFRSDFRFHPDNQDSIDFASQSRFPFGPADPYDRADEEQVADIIFTSAERIDLDLSDLDPRVYELGVDTLRTQLRYELAIIDSLTTEGGGFDTTLYKGVLTFIMRLESGEWGLQSWSDNRSGEPVDTWGVLRGRTKP